MDISEYTFEDIVDEYTEDIKNKSISQTQSYGEIIAKPSNCILSLPFRNAFERIYNFEVFPDDTWIITFPKCGTTWTNEMVWLLKNNLDFEKAKSTDLITRVPFFDSETLISKRGKFLESCPSSITKSKELERPRCIKSHLPVQLLPKELWTVKPKIVYVTRDPRDVAISYYHHHRLWNGYQGTLEDFVEVFLHDRVVYSPFWGHVLGFANLEDKSHILFNSYEEMKMDLPKVIRKTAEFLNVDLTDKDVEDLAEHLSFKSMKNNTKVNGEDWAVEVKTDNKADMNDENLSFIRKGESGGWRNEFDETIVEKFKTWSEANLNDRDFKDYPWPQ